MKKIFISLILLCVAGCSTSNIESSKSTIKLSDIKGYWVQTEEDWSGDVTDLTDNQYSYLEITDNQLAFYTISFNEDEGYGVSEKYFKIEENKLYYDYYELKDRTLEEIKESTYGGAFIASINENNLVLLEYSNGINEEDGYSKDTYKKITAKDWPIEE